MSQPEITVHCIHDDNAPMAIILKGSDMTKCLYDKVCDGLNIIRDTIDLEYDGEHIPDNETRIEETTLCDGVDIVTTVGKKTKAIQNLKVRGIEPTPKALCEAAAAGNCELITLLIYAGVDVNCVDDSS